MDRSLSSGLTAVLLILGFVLLVSAMAPREPARPPTTYSEFLEQLDAGRVRDVTLRTRDNSLRVTPERGPAYETGYAPALGNQLVDRIRAADVSVTIEPAPRRWWSAALPFVVVLVLVGAILFFVMRRRARNPMGGFGRAPARRPEPDTPAIGFSEVAGADEAVEELGEIVAFLGGGARFHALGARIPKGVLLYGPPGTGKTLLARAVAGEAGVPFFSISGSDFVEMFVGVGASRVRDLFEQAKASAPCIVFVDEIDAVGRHRGAGVGGGHDEREQTLNQLLVELDGFEATDSIILIAATNRPDILDPALLRPGRFDRQILVERPDRRGRAQILAVHTRGKPLAAVDLDTLAAATPGFTGADLANVVNEAALLAGRAGRRQIEAADFEEAILRVVAGPEKRTRVLSEHERLVTA
ncbi:MAG TPA: ATP-dependent metallopeptidase FtsH/Yme1/Tma family protein, partial [Solirubrobacter sp.]|nr:ATP-dependent metallopeptidase FtsH/Yme1/Tma family protein [Solirubrobacter sp.]